MQAEREHHHQVTHVEVDSDHQGQRVDNFLITRLKGVPKSRIYRILRKGEVRINKKRVKPTYRLQEGDLVRIPPVRLSEQAATPDRTSTEWIEKTILYEDDQILVLNKPSGIAVHGGSGIRYGVIETLRGWRSEAANYELVHRLDRATSGVLLIAKKRRALRFLHDVIREHGMEKRYLALVSGKMRKTKVVTAPLRKNVLRSGERMVRVDPEGKSAESRFSPKLSCDSSTLVEVEIVTGRTHQIRVHGVHIGHPLAGDDRYGLQEYNQKMGDLGLSRLFLHAHQLTFPHPRDETTMRIEAPLPPQLTEVVDRIRKMESCRTF